MRTNALALLAVLAAAAPALAADRTVGPGRTYATIQEAFDAAAPGDRVVISRGVYAEGPLLTTNGVTVIGTSGVVIDGVGVEGGRRHGIVIRADDVTVEGITFRGTATAVDAIGARCRVVRCTARSASSAGVNIEGAGAEVTSCIVRGTDGDGIAIVGADAVVTGCSVFGVSGDGIRVYGTGPRITSNTLSATGADGIEVAGDGADVSKNTVSRAGSDAIHVDGGTVLVSGNRATAARGQLVEVNGDSARVLSNTLTYATAGGIYVAGAEFTVSSNRVSHCADDCDGIVLVPSETGDGGLVERNVVTDGIEFGFAVYARGVTLRRNVVNRMGSEDESGYYLRGDAIVVEDCVATECDWAGFRIEGSGTTLRRCRVSGSTSFGYVVYGAGNTLDGCASTGAVAGIWNFGSGTNVQSGKYTKATFDVCRTSTATFGTFTGVRLVTGGRDEIYEPSASNE